MSYNSIVWKTLVMRILFGVLLWNCMKRYDKDFFHSLELYDKHFVTFCASPEQKTIKLLI